MKKARMLLALGTVLAIMLSVAPGGAAIKKKTLGVRTYELSGSGLQVEGVDPTCDLSRIPVSDRDLPHPSDIERDGLPTDDVPAYPTTPRTAPEPVGSQLPKGCQATPDGRIDHGGLVFPKIGGTSRTAWVKVFIRDELTGTPVYFSLCQNFDGDDSCGESAGSDPTNPNQVKETSMRGCSPGAPYAKINTRYPTVIFIWAASTGCSYLNEVQDTYLATRGTVKMVRYWL